MLVSYAMLFILAVLPVTLLVALDGLLLLNTMLYFIGVAFAVKLTSLAGIVNL